MPSLARLQKLKKINTIHSDNYSHANTAVSRDGFNLSYIRGSGFAPFKARGTVVYGRHLTLNFKQPEENRLENMPY